MSKLINCELKKLKVDEVVFKAYRATNNRELTAQEINAEILIDKSGEENLLEFIQNQPSYSTFISEKFEEIDKDVTDSEEDLEINTANLDASSLKTLWKKLLDSESEIKEFRKHTGCTCIQESSSQEEIRFHRCFRRRRNQ